MKWLAALAVIATALWAASVEKPRVDRGVVMGIERSFDVAVTRAADPFDVLGSTQGVYLDGFGTVFTMQLNLIVSPNINPFRQKMSPKEVELIHARKMQRLDLLKQNMRQMLRGSAVSLETMPSSERIVLAVSLFYYNWEDKTGLPSQVVMQGERQKLLSPAAVQSIRTQEY